MKRKWNVNNSYVFFVLAWLLMVSSCATGQKAKEEQGKPLETTPIVFYGLRTNALPVGWQVFENQADWKTFWSQNSFTPAPEIDFENNVLIIYFLGQKPNTGYSVKIISAREYADNVVVQAEEREPAPGQFYIQIIVFPYDAVLISKTGKPIELKVGKKEEQS